MIINYTFFSQVAHYLFFTSFGKKNPPEIKTRVKKSKDGCTQVRKDFEHQHKTKESPATEASLG
jgi:hypothetical protein